jgi:hypothetical protein
MEDGAEPEGEDVKMCTMKIPIHPMFIRNLHSDALGHEP